jgi:hypothetical protein
MMRTLRRIGADRSALVTGVVAGVVAATIVYAALRQHLASDFDAHVQFTANGLRTGLFPGNLLFYLLNAFFAGFSADWWWLKLSLDFVVGLAVGAKALLTARFLNTEFQGALGAPRTAVVASMGAAVLALVFCLPSQNHYLGAIPPNVWHNTTTIVLMPFAVGLFWTSLLFLRTGETRYLWYSVPLAALNVAAKPSFILCFLPVFPVVALIRFGWNSTSRRALWLTAAAAAFLAAQYVYIYAAPPSGGTGAPSSVAIDPLRVWEIYTSQIPRALIASYLFPIAALVLGGATIRHNRGVQYALALAGVGLIEYALLAETGARLPDGNFTWQAIVTQYVLFMALIGALVPWFQSRAWGLRQTLITLALAAHLWAGFNYLDHWFSTHSFV